MKIAIVKPDHRAAGGFEAVVERLADGLRARGHGVDVVQVDATPGPDSGLGARVDEASLNLFREFFFHVGIVARFEALDVSGYDAVLCTQPGSYAVSHPHKVILFYHHARSFYDLQSVIETVRGHDIELHHLAAHIVRDIDSCFLRPDVPILAGSRRVKQRLAEHNGLDANVEVFGAGIDSVFFDADVGAFETVLCVGRHEFPKRVELFLHAMCHVAGVEGRVAGVGAFTDRLMGIDAWLRLRHLDEALVPAWDPAGCLVDDHALWLRDTIHAPMADLRAAREALERRTMRSTVRFLGRVSQPDLVREYQTARVVVCPAFDEDFGLTCLEAMACGKPVIACRDGGGYVELIDEGVDGLLVEPNGPAIAAAIRRLQDDGLARAMGARGREKTRAYTWDRAVGQVERALQRA